MERKEIRSHLPQWNYRLLPNMEMGRVGGGGARGGAGAGGGGACSLSRYTDAHTAPRSPNFAVYFYLFSVLLVNAAPQPPLRGGGGGAGSRRGWRGDGMRRSEASGA